MIDDRGQLSRANQERIDAMWQVISEIEAKRQATKNRRTDISNGIPFR